ncbi:MAG: hypothetical protein ACMUIE_00900 [Thermoplasmatota archaeon]
MTEKKSQKSGQDLKIVRSSDHRSHYVIGAIPQWTDTDLRLHLYNEVMEGPGGPYYVSTSLIILPKNTVSKLLDVLKAAVRSEGVVQQTEASALPLDVAIAVDREIFEREKKPKKKVQKIRRR